LAIAYNPILFIVVMLFSAHVIKNLRIGYFTLIHKPAVILTDESITITAKNDTIKWTDVKDVYMTYRSIGVLNSMRFQYITIRVREPEKYLKAIKNPIIRGSRWLTRNWRPSPFEVNLFLVRGDEDENYRLVLKYYQNNRVSKPILPYSQNI
jgi:hypothetical protein